MITKIAILLAAMTIIAIPVFADGTISGTITVGGSALPNIVVGIRSVTASTYGSPTADADQFCYTNGSGHYAAGVADGAYHVGVWADGYRIQEKTVTVSGDAPTADFTLTDVQGADAALHRELTGYAIWNDRDWVINAKHSNWEWNGDKPASAAVDGDRTSYKFSVLGNMQVVKPSQLVVDLASDLQISQALIRFRQDTQPSGYKVQFAADAGTGVPAIDSSVWQDWYVSPGFDSAIPIRMCSGFNNASYYGCEALTGVPSAARYWRVYVENGRGWGASSWGIIEFELYADNLAATGAVSGTVTAAGVLQPNAWVGIKGAENAFADAAFYVQTDGSGHFTTPVVGAGKWYLSAWVDGFQFTDTSVVVNGNQTCNIVLTNLQGTNYALGKDVLTYSGPHTREPVYQAKGVDGTFNSDNEGDFAQVWGDTATSLAAYCVDLGSDESVTQAEIDWRGYDRPAYGDYKIQYAVDGSDASINSADWVDWYVGTPGLTAGCPIGPDLGAPGPLEGIKGPAVAARYWRISVADADYYGRGGVGIREFQLYSSTEFATLLIGHVYIGTTPKYNAVIQIVKIGGATQTIVSGLDGSYSVAGLTAGDYTIFCDAIGAKPYFSTTFTVEAGIVKTVDITLTADYSETNLVTNGDFEDGTTGWAAGSGHPWYGGVLFPHGSPWNNGTWGPCPDANPDQSYVANLAGQGFGGTTAGGIQLGNPQPNPQWWLGEYYLDKSQANWWGTVSAITSTKVDIIPAAGWDLGWWYSSHRISAGIFLKQTAHGSYAELLRPYLVNGGSNNPKYMTIIGDMLADGFDPTGTDVEYYMARAGGRYWLWNWVTPDSTHQIAVDPAYLYNIYFKVRSNESGGNSPWYRVLFRDSAGIQLSGNGSGIATGTVSPGEWYQAASGMIMISPPSNAATLDLEFMVNDANAVEPTQSGGLLVDDIVVDRLPLPKLSDFKSSPDGTLVSLPAISVSFAPMSGGVVSGDFFYIEQPDRTSGIRVMNMSSHGTPTAGTVVAVSGTIETGTGPYGDGVPEGERYIAAGTVTTAGTSNVFPLGVNTRAMYEDVKLAGMLVRTSGVIRALDEDNSPNYQWFTIADGYAEGGIEKATKVALAAPYGDPSLTSKIAVGDFVKVTGVVSQDDPEHKVILLKAITFADPALPTPTNPAHTWTCGFEPGEGFTAGTTVNGQVGWSVITSPTGPTTQAGGAATVVASPDPVMGTQSLKLTATHTDSDAALRDTVLIRKLTTEDDLKWMVIKFSIWRTPGTQALPETPGYPGPYTFPAGNFPIIQSNYPFWWSKDPYDNGGLQWDYSHETRPLGSGSHPTVAGRFAEVVMYMDFANAKQYSWYDGVLIDNGIAFSPSVSKFSSIDFYYQATYPFTAGEYGRPSYIDNISASWATTAD